MIIIWGSRDFKKIKALTGPYTCNACGAVSMFQVLRVATWFTLFWIPLFPYSFKRYHVCPMCGDITPLTKQQAEELIATDPEAATRR